jgi:protein-S-isoprenylcysteine O-methyltransferase Ste14
VLTATVLFNCRSPHHLDAAGDRRADTYVRPGYLTWGLVGQATAVLAMATAYCLARRSPARRSWTPAEAVAAAVCAAGTALRAWCFTTLGRLFTYEVGIRSEHELISSGPYTLLLHPSYTGAAMAGLGFCAYVGAMRRPAWALAVTLHIAVLLGALRHACIRPCCCSTASSAKAAAPCSALAVAPARPCTKGSAHTNNLAPALVSSPAALRIANEERVLAEHFGEAWARHAATRWRIIPFLF